MKSMQALIDLLEFAKIGCLGGGVILHIKTSSISKWNMRLQQPFANSNSWYLYSPCHPACECAGKSHGDRPARKISWQVCYANQWPKISDKYIWIHDKSWYYITTCHAHAAIHFNHCMHHSLSHLGYKHRMAVLRCHSLMRVALNDLAHDAHGIQKLEMCKNTFQILWD